MRIHVNTVMLYDRKIFVLNEARDTRDKRVQSLYATVVCICMSPSDNSIVHQEITEKGTPIIHFVLAWVCRENGKRTIARRSSKTQIKGSRLCSYIHAILYIYTLRESILMIRWLTDHAATKREIKRSKNIHDAVHQPLYNLHYSRVDKMPYLCDRTSLTA